ncbi:MAG TPA: adenylate/guanylate cyclase domain-containing protein [Candidatus Acidoferrales bacterium]|nr:adenylate/guanylate cyclase domain-containing protein [Candidatus Acidoferrales bacterium]
MLSRRRVPIQTYLAALFALLTLAIGLVTAAIFYERMKSESLRAAGLLFDRTTTVLAQDIGQVRWEVSYALALATSSDLARAKTSMARLHSLNVLRSIIQSNDLAVAAYVGYPNGDFFFLLRLDPTAPSPISAPPNAAFLLRSIERAPGRKTDASYSFFDRSFRLLSRRPDPSPDFDPRTRPWFAAGTHDVYVTSPYIFYTTHHLGITLSQRSPAGSVFGVDIDLSSISEKLASMQPTTSALAAVVEPSGEVLAYSKPLLLEAANQRLGASPATLAQMNAPPLLAAYQAASPNVMQSEGSFKGSNGRVWLYRMTPVLRRQGAVRGFAIAIPEDELLTTAIRVRNDALIACLALILVSIPMAFWLAKIIARPLNGLRSDAHAIRNLDFSHRPLNESFIAEIDEFARTFATMRQHIREYNESATRFIPREFLSQLKRLDIKSLQLGDHAEETMTILFSDIRSFTTLSGGMTPEQTFKFVNSYLTRIGPIIREYHGFIDKYIGDAIMALFPESPAQAVDAAVAMQKRVVVYNEERSRAGYPSVAIGIGVHSGDLMLGTIGETQRFETTVISDAVNIASRLESLTKTFGVLILTSGTVMSEVDQTKVPARRLGDVQVKGATHPVTIYDVFAADPPDLLEHKIVTRDAFDLGRVAYAHGDFTEAYRYFREVARDKRDHAAAYYRDRSAIMASAVQTLEWDGVEHMESK